MSPVQKRPRLEEIESVWVDEDGSVGFRMNSGLKLTQYGQECIPPLNVKWFHHPTEMRKVIEDSRLTPTEYYELIRRSGGWLKGEVKLFTLQKWGHTRMYRLGGDIWKQIMLHLCFESTSEKREVLCQVLKKLRQLKIMKKLGEKIDFDKEWESTISTLK